MLGGDVQPLERPSRRAPGIPDTESNGTIPTRIGFEYTPNDPLHLHHGAGFEYEDDESNEAHGHAAFPLSLGDGGMHGLGADVHCLRGPYAGTLG